MICKDKICSLSFAIYCLNYKNHQLRLFEGELLN